IGIDGVDDRRIDSDFVFLVEDYFVPDVLGWVGLFGGFAIATVGVDQPVGNLRRNPLATGLRRNAKRLCPFLRRGAGKPLVAIDWAHLVERPGGRNLRRLNLL